MPKGIYKRTSNMNTGKYKHKSGKDCFRYIDGRTLKLYYCKNCDKSITYRTALYGTGLCKKCHRGKNEKNTQKDKKKKKR